MQTMTYQQIISFIKKGEKGETTIQCNRDISGTEFLDLMYLKDGPENLQVSRVGNTEDQIKVTIK